MSDQAGFHNTYDDAHYAASYAQLEWEGTYRLIQRDLPGILREHITGRRALDFGCGTGRSTRFLRDLGFDAVGVDISEPMLARARERDPAGRYRLVPDGDLGELPAGSFDVVLSAFTFDNIPTREKKIRLFRDLRRLLGAGGRIVSLVSAPEIYVNEWASFSTKDFPGNRAARCGDKVLIVMLDVDDKRPVEDILWTDEGYCEVYAEAGLGVVKKYEPLGRAGEGQPWVSETAVAPWVIYVLEG